MKEEIVLVGGGGHCHSCIDVIESTGLYSIVGILDQPEMVGKSILGYPVIGTDKMIPVLVAKSVMFSVTVGQIKSSAVRQKLVEKIISVGGELPPVIASTAYVSRHARIDAGTIVMHHAFVNANTSVGKYCILNTGSIIEHDCKVGDFCHVSTNTVVNGNCDIGDNVFIGSATVVNQGLSICSDIVIGAGSTVVNTLSSNGTYRGLVK